MLDEIILETKAQLYQYVGDEIVMTWTLKKGTENNNSLNFYFYVKQLLKNKENYFLDKYGIFPEFKGALHFGDVAVTEIGSLKKDIAFHGDTINTTARICQKVKELNSTLLISTDLLSILPEIDNNYNINFLGLFELKGKNNIIGLSEIVPKE
jgi:adenylate cyclase